MLTPDVRFDGFDTRDWVRLLECFAGARLDRSGPGKPVDSGGVVAVVEQGRVRKVLHTRRGAIELAGCAQPLDPMELAQRHGARWAVVLERGSLDRLMERLGAQTKPEHDLLDQLLIAWTTVRELVAQQAMRVWPTTIAAVPVPTRGLVNTALNLVCADGHVTVLGVLQGRELWTSVAMRRRGPALDWIAGPWDLRPALGELQGQLSVDHRHVTRAVGAMMGPVGLGVYATREDWSKLLGRASAPGTWARAVGNGQVVVQPGGPGLAIPLAVDASRVAVVATRAALGRLARPGGLIRRKTMAGGAALELDDAMEPDLWASLGGLLTLWKSGGSR